MPDYESVTEEIEGVLGVYIKERMRLDDLILGWPEPNQSLDMPCLSIMAGSPETQVFPPFYHSKGETQNHKSVVKYVTGQYNWSMQLDLWCRSKEERHDRFEKLHQVLHSQLSQGVGCLFLTLEKYHGIIASYLFAGYDFIDGEEASQREEWRAKITVLANCFVISTDPQYIITEEPELDFDTSDQPL